MTAPNPDLMETPPEATPATPAAPKLSVTDMLDREGFASWRETIPSARSIPLHEDYRDKIAAQFEAFEASQVVSDGLRDVCDEKLTGDDKESGIVSRISEEEFQKMQENIARRTLSNPGYAAELKRDLEAIQTNPAAIATNEQELIALQQKAVGAADLAEKLKKAHEKSGEVVDLIRKGNSVPTLRWHERVQYALKYNTDFDTEIGKLAGKTDKSSLDKKAKLEKFRDVKKAEEELLKLRGAFKTKYDLPFDVDWNTQLEELGREIAELTPKVAEAGTVEAKLATLKAETERLKQDIQTKRQKVFDSIPNSAEIRVRAAGGIHTQLKEALTSTDLDALDLAVERVSHFEELAKTGVTSNYLNGLFPKGMSLETYKTDLTAQVKGVVAEMVRDTLDGMYPGELYGAFRRDLDELITRGTKKLGFDSEAKSREFFLVTLEHLKDDAAQTPGTGKASNLECLILQLRRGKRA